MNKFIETIKIQVAKKQKALIHGTYHLDCAFSVRTQIHVCHEAFVDGTRAKATQPKRQVQFDQRKTAAAATTKQAQSIINTSGQAYNWVLFCGKNINEQRE